LIVDYGKSPFLMGKLTISMAIINSYMLVYQRVMAILTGYRMDGDGMGHITSDMICVSV